MLAVLFRGGGPGGFFLVLEQLPELAGSGREKLNSNVWPIAHLCGLARGLGAFHGARPTPRVPIVRRNRTKCLGDPQWYRTPDDSYRMTALFDTVTPRRRSDLPPG